MRLLVGRFGRSANLDTYRQVADVEATVSRCREMALEKRLAVDLLLQKYLRGSSIGPVLFKERTTAMERSAQGELRVSGSPEFVFPGDAPREGVG